MNMGMHAYMGKRIADLLVNGTLLVIIVWIQFGKRGQLPYCRGTHKIASATTVPLAPWPEISA
jgi:hypothetical protein